MARPTSRPACGSATSWPARPCSANGIDRVVLASDGVANVGLTDADGILRQIRDDAAAGIELVSVGVGMGNYNDALLEQLADQGDGFYAYVNDLDEARRLFTEDLTGTLQTVALDAKVQVEFDPDGVATYRLLGYENRAIADRDFRDPRVDAGAIGAGHAVTALYEIRLRDASRATTASDRPAALDRTRGPRESALPARSGPTTSRTRSRRPTRPSSSTRSWPRPPRSCGEIGSDGDDLRDVLDVATRGTAACRRPTVHDFLEFLERCRVGSCRD